MSFYLRHPRFTVFFLVALLFSVILFLSAPPPPAFMHRPYPLGFRRPAPGTSVQEQLSQSEHHYQQTLKERQRLIAKFGPTVGTVDSFPTPESGDFYTLWDFFTASFACPHRVQRVGTLGDGGKWVCGLERIAQKKECIIYSVGINGESSFEAGLLESAPGCKVYGYDFSVNSFGPEIDANPALAGRAFFRPYALGGVDKHAPGEHPKQYTLASLMRMNGHSFIDILKIDIEGAEFEALDALVDAYTSNDGADGMLPFGQLQLEIHARNSEYAEFPRFLEWWQRLERAGLRPFWTEPNLVYVNLVRGVKPDLSEYSFINTRGNHELVADEF